MQEIAAVAWDIDGTLVDSEPLHTQSLLATLREHGPDIEDIDETTFLGMGLPAVWDFLTQRAEMPLSRETWSAAIRDHYQRHAERLVPRDGTVEAVDRLHRLGTRQICVSGGARQTVETNLSRFPLRDRFEFAISRDDVARSKPDPEPYILACRRLGLHPSACLAIEDSPPGVQSAKAAGLQVVAWPQYEELWFPEADRVVTSLTDLFDTLLEAQSSE